MTRQEVITWQNTLFPNQTLPQICIDIRMSINGASDSWDEKRYIDSRDMLKCRLDTWDFDVMTNDCKTPDHPNFWFYFIDSKVRDIVWLTVKALDVYLEKKE